MRTFIIVYVLMLTVRFTSDYVFFFILVDQSGDQLSEDPGFALLHVCAALLPGVNVKLTFPSFEHTVLQCH